ncbi:MULTISPECIES: SpoIIE family protein phosphatase [Nocardia]|uniref:SpoIIE family protein phosphatase n=2 Tax=Nocardia salmonicida TaxID=53431 RepID=A0ABZ1N448_9NOCA|nr:MULTISPECIES: SpoIIE family protein phosphatase [Nocardia]WKG07190.1 SpoIIE family protein phosphatase [Nocardia sp. PE-7]
MEWSTAGRALPGQDVSGDRALVLDTGAGVLFAVLDGLGHGAPAAEAADRAMAILTENCGEPLDVLMVLCHRAMVETRGAAVSLALIEPGETLQWLGVGNVDSRLLTLGPAGPELRATMLLTGGIVGYRLPSHLQPQTLPIRPGDLLLMATDGIVAVGPESLDLAKTATAIAGDLLARDAKDTDDALVLAARFRGPCP